MILTTDNIHAEFVNLSHRTDRLKHMHDELGRIGLTAHKHDGIRTKGFEWNRNPYKTMFRRTPGAIGCMLSQIEVMEAAHKLGKHAMVLEDDLLFCDDFFDRLKIIGQWLEGRSWDTFWLGGTVHYPHPYWHSKGHPNMKGDCHCKLGVDAEPTEHKHIYRSYGSFSTHAYIVNHSSIENVIAKLHEGISTTIGIDYSFIRLAPKMNNYVFLPGMVIQKNNASDIGNGWTMFSGFSSLGSHWFQKETL